MDQALPVADALVRPWRTAAYVAAAIAAIELVLLLVIGGGALMGAVTKRLELEAQELELGPGQLRLQPGGARGPLPALAVQDQPLAGRQNLEAATRVVELLEQEDAALEQQWKLRLERARYEARRAERQYDLCDPENRVVARTLEARWNEKTLKLSASRPPR